MIRLPGFQYLQLRTVALARTRFEACALVLALRDVVVGVIPVDNVAADPETSFELSPAALGLWAAIEARLPELEVIVFHSHHGYAHPSSGDARWAEPERRALIYGLQRDEMRAFKYVPGGELDRQRLRPVEIPLENV